MPFVSVSIYNNSVGIIKPEKERIALQTVTNGKVMLTNISNNKKVAKGDTLLILNNNALQHQLQKVSYQTDELTSFINDLELILNRKSLKKLTSLKYKQEISVFHQKISELQTRYRKISDDYNRNQKLFEKGVIARIVLNNSKLEYDLAVSNLKQFKKQQGNTWQSQLITYKNKLKELESNQTQLNGNKELSVITITNGDLPQEK